MGDEQWQQDGQQNQEAAAESGSCGAAGHVSIEQQHVCCSGGL